MVSRLLIDSASMIKAELTLPHMRVSKEMTRRIKWQVLDQRRHVPHLERKLYHMVNGLLCFVLYAFILTDTQALWVLGLVGGGWFLVDVLRLRSPHISQAVLRVFGRLMRRDELKSLTGNSYFILGLLIIVLAFPRPIVSLAVLYLALGDPVAAIVGTRWGRRRIVGEKSVEGAVANFIVAFAVSYLVGTWLFVSPRPFLLGLIGGASSVIAELLPLKIDDNLTIPVVSGTLLWILSHYLPLFVL